MLYTLAFINVYTLATLRSSRRRPSAISSVIGPEASVARVDDSLIVVSYGTVKICKYMIEGGCTVFMFLSSLSYSSRTSCSSGLTSDEEAPVRLRREDGSLRRIVVSSIASQGFLRV